MSEAKAQVLEVLQRLINSCSFFFLKRSPINNQTLQKSLENDVTDMKRVLVVRRGTVGGIKELRISKDQHLPLVERCCPNIRSGTER